MIVRDELNRYFHFSSSEIMSILQEISLTKEQEIHELKNKITKYEEKRRAEDAFYQSLSPVRKFFASRPPSHHQAVEYIVHVKDRLKQIDTLKQRIYEINMAIRQCDELTNGDELELSSVITEDIIKQKKVEEY
jgi:acetyl-CoA carboxylase alpha subunit